jgi:hypothetical protein
MDVELQILKHLARDAQPTVSFIDKYCVLEFRLGRSDSASLSGAQGLLLLSEHLAIKNRLSGSK